MCQREMLMAAGMVDLFDKLKEGRNSAAVSHHYGINESYGSWDGGSL